MTIAEVGALLEVHPNTAREHLDALVERGLLDRTLESPSGRGRPAWRYGAAHNNPEPDSRVRDYVSLTDALAAHIERTSADPAGDAISAGQAWGESIASEHVLDKGSPVDVVIQTLDDLGFAPALDDSSIRLHRCPFLDTAKRSPTVVCNVHLGLVRGMLSGLGADTPGPTMLPFAEPGACLLRLGA